MLTNSNGDKYLHCPTFSNHTCPPPRFPYILGILNRFAVCLNKLVFRLVADFCLCNASLSRLDSSVGSAPSLSQVPIWRA